MKEKDKQLIKSTLNTLIELTYSNMRKIEQDSGEENLRLLKDTEETLLKMIDEHLFKS